MQTATPNSIEPSKSLPGNHHRRRRRFRQRRPNPNPSPNANPSLPAVAPQVRHEISAGGIIYRRKPSGVEIFFIKDPFSRWTFPKGHQEAGENLLQTAIREIMEETGLANLRMVAPLGRTTFRFRREGIVIQKVVYFYLFEAPQDAKEHLTGEGAIYEAQWAKMSKVFSVSSYKNSDRLLVKALRIISSQTRSPQRPPRIA